MSIDNSSTSSLSNRPATEARGTDNDRPADKPREAPPKEQVDRFRQLMQHGRQEGRAGVPGREESPRGAPESGRHAAQAAARHGEEQAALRGLVGQQGTQDGTDNNGMGANSVDGADLLAMMQAQAALRDGSGLPPPTAPAPPMASGKALAEMLERHVRQLAVDGAASAEGEGHVLLRMADATLPGTDLLLSKTADGWHLRADVRSRDSYDAIREAAPALARRFAEHNLGQLEIDPRFDG
ncbi:type III secretion HpaP family protein [Luteimonas saliphila]|uniref:type III secretion HpaP family protein n=1 Tax=Luteimonas saliphila TaxID=2804919 RepID=UPI00192DEA4B|nr:type III secretion HpaP family protein [Luteimonas saliphila]